MTTFAKALAQARTDRLLDTGRLDLFLQRVQTGTPLTAEEFRWLNTHPFVDGVEVVTEWCAETRLVYVKAVHQSTYTGGMAMSNNAQRRDMYRINLHAYGFADPLVFDQSDTDNDEITIKRLRYAEDADIVALLIKQCRREATIEVIPLDENGDRAGVPLRYSGKMIVRTHTDSNVADLGWLTVQIERARVG